jgi:acyl dehydratase
MQSEDFVATYSRKDAILYALSIGYGSHANDEDLKYVFEQHKDFATVPTFGLTLTFWAQTAQEQHLGNDRLPTFPPPMMRHMGLLPRHCLRDPLSFNPEEFPVLHTFQSITWHNDMPVPTETCSVQTVHKGRFVSVIPKDMGTFVTTETTIDEFNREGSTSSSRPLCTVRSTALILGLSCESIDPYRLNDRSDVNKTAQFSENDGNEFLFEKDVAIQPNQALLYRLSSGDSNAIHVDSSAVPLLASRDDGSALLHGLCTIGIAARIISSFVTTTFDSGNFPLQLQHLEGRFASPVFMGDTVRIEAWRGSGLSQHDNEKISINFVVRNAMSRQVVVDRGITIFIRKHPSDSFSPLPSRL